MFEGENWLKCEVVGLNIGVNVINELWNKDEDDE